MLQATLQGLPGAERRRRTQALLERVGLTEAADRRVGGYSGGMKRRLDLALALVHSPRILFLDEPTTGLDPQSRSALWEEVARLAHDEGMTVFLTTQYLEEADVLADRIGIIDHGHIVAEGTPAQLKAEIGGPSVEVTPAEADDGDRLAELLSRLRRDAPQRNGARHRAAARAARPSSPRSSASSTAPTCTSRPCSCISPRSTTCSWPRRAASSRARARRRAGRATRRRAPRAGAAGGGVAAEIALSARSAPAPGPDLRRADPRRRPPGRGAHAAPAGADHLPDDLPADPVRDQRLGAQPRHPHPRLPDPQLPRLPDRDAVRPGSDVRLDHRRGRSRQGHRDRLPQPAGDDAAAGRGAARRPARRRARARRHPGGRLPARRTRHRRHASPAASAARSCCSSSRS